MTYAEHYGKEKWFVREPEVQALADELDAVYTNFLTKFKAVDKDHPTCGECCKNPSVCIHIRQDVGLCKECQRNLFQQSEEVFLASYHSRRKAIEQESLRKPRMYPWSDPKDFTIWDQLKAKGIR